MQIHTFCVGKNLDSFVRISLVCLNGLVFRSVICQLRLLLSCGRSIASEQQRNV
jgi:hypothetical protein